MASKDFLILLGLAHSSKNWKKSQLRGVALISKVTLIKVGI